MEHRSWLLAILVTALLSALAVPPLYADAAPTLISSCNPTYVITQPGTYVVTQNLIAAPRSDCIDVASSNVVLQLSGHTLQGSDKESNFGFSGIAIPALAINTANNVTVVNGTITGFFDAIFDDGSQTTIHGITATENIRGIETNGSNGNIYTNNHTTNNKEFGILLGGGTSNASVVGNLVTGNGLLGIFIFKDDPSSRVVNNRIINNRASGNGPPDDLFDGTPGCGSNIWLHNTGTRNQSCIH